MKIMNKNRKVKAQSESTMTDSRLLFGDWMRLQIVFLPVCLGVLQFGRKFPGVSAGIEMIGMFAGLLFAPVFTCVRQKQN